MMKKAVFMIIVAVLNSAAFAQTKRVIEEEYTGTRCGWCPRGTVGMELVQEKYGDRVIQVAAHYPPQDGTSMATLSKWSGYENIMARIVGVPTAFLDRRFDIDPYHGRNSKGFGAPEMIDQLLEQKCIADIDVEAKWTDEKYQWVEITSNVKFYENLNREYRLAYVITADSMYKDDVDWAQLNYYYNLGDDSSITSDPNLEPLTHEKKYIKGLKYNHVPVAGAGVELGMEGSLPPSVATTENYVHRVQLEIPVFETTETNPHPTVIPKEHLNAIAFILDAKSGYIVNVNKMKIPAPATTGINAPSTKEVFPSKTIYAVDGSLRPKAMRGLNIIRMEDGSMRKVWVK
ncbi:MAG: thioredoxin family protein [Prevotella sp.]|nr:thioredoxin family protein [Prevotella sp.]